MVDVPSFDKLFIGGEWVTPASTSVIEVHNPATEELIGTVLEGNEVDMDRAVEAARNAFDHGPWPTMPATERADAMGEGWFLKLRLADPKELNALMDQAAYDAFVAEQQ